MAFGDRIQVSRFYQKYRVILYKLSVGRHLRRMLLGVNCCVFQSRENRCLTKGRTALHWAIREHKIAIVTALLEFKDIDVEVKSKRGWTPLHTAIHYNNSASVEALLNVKVNINAKSDNINYKGWTPLHLAMHLNNSVVVKALLSKGADMNVQTDKGEKLLDFVKTDSLRKLLFDYAILYKQKSILEQLIIIDNAQSKQNLTYLHQAAICSHDPEVFRQLFAAKADINAKSDTTIFKGWTSLHFAMHHNNPVAVEALLSQGSDINAQTDKGETPFDLVEVDNRNAKNLMLFLFSCDQHKINIDTKIITRFVGDKVNEAVTLAHQILEACKQLYETEPLLALNILHYINNHERKHQTHDKSKRTTALASIFRTPPKGEHFWILEYHRGDKGTAANLACEWYEQILNLSNNSVIVQNIEASMFGNQSKTHNTSPSDSESIADSDNDLELKSLTKKFG